MAGRGRWCERQVNSTQRQTSARLPLRGSKGRLGQSRDPGDFRLLFFTMRLSGSEAYRGYISTSSSVYTGGRANQGTSISVGECGTTWLSANFISPVLLFFLSVKLKFGRQLNTGVSGSAVGARLRPGGALQLLLPGGRMCRRRGCGNRKS